MLAERLPGLLPDLSRAESLEVSRVHSAAGLSLLSGGLMVRPPSGQPSRLGQRQALFLDTPEPTDETVDELLFEDVAAVGAARRCVGRRPTNGRICP